jgi:HEPN domain-containing protein
MTKADLKNLRKYWLDGSIDDLESAREIIRLTSRYGSGLFYLHLSLEKMLKYIYVTQNEAHPPFTHNLVFLVEKCGIKISQLRQRDLITINEFNLSTRYPDEKKNISKNFTKAFAKKWLKKVEDIHKFLSDC